MDTVKPSPLISAKHKTSNILFYSLAAALIIAYLVFQPDSLSLNQMRDIGTSYDLTLATYLFSFFIMLLCALTPLPAELISLVNTFIYSPTEAFFITWTSAVLSAQAGYEYGRLNKLDPCKYSDSNKISRWLHLYGYKSLTVMRLIPIVPFFALNICSGIFKLDRYRYLFITGLTIIPAVSLLTFSPHFFL